MKGLMAPAGRAKVSASKKASPLLPSPSHSPAAAVGPLPFAVTSHGLPPGLPAYSPPAGASSEGCTPTNPSSGRGPAQLSLPEKKKSGLTPRKAIGKSGMASGPRVESSSPATLAEAQATEFRARDRADEDAVSLAPGSGNPLFPQSGDASVLCLERAGGLTRAYRPIDPRGSRGSRRAGSFAIRCFDQKDGPIAEIAAFLKSYFLPEGYPATVSPSFMPYMQWRGLQHFFGGAIGVFTTRSLLHSLGVSRSSSTSSALAVNWVLKDGAGRLGKMLFARRGKKFDCDLKQMRFLSAMLMEVGAAIELCTMAAPPLFLPMACAANVFKNVGAVSNTATRAPIYKAFARRENIGDVTAKGECISNLADLLGTGLGILLARHHCHLHMAATFGALSAGYLLSSFHEVKAVQVPTLNRARFSVAVRSFLETGRVPSLAETNARERILVLPWTQEQPMEVGARVSEAFAGPEELRHALRMFKDEPYLLAFRPSSRRAMVVLKETACSADVLRAAFQAQVLLHLLHSNHQRPASPLLRRLPLPAASALRWAAKALPSLPAPLRPAGSAARKEVAGAGGCGPAADAAAEAARWSAKGPVEVAVAAARNMRGLLEGRPAEVGERGAEQQQQQQQQQGGRACGAEGPAGGRLARLSAEEVRVVVGESLVLTRQLFAQFQESAAEQGWTMGDSLLNPGDARLLTGSGAGR